MMVIRMSTQRVIVRLESVRLMILMLTMMPPHNVAEKITNRAPGLSAAKPGRTMTIAPVKPMASASVRRRRTFSPRKTVASRVANSGAVKLSAVASASGVSRSPI